MLMTFYLNFILKFIFINTRNTHTHIFEHSITKIMYFHDKMMQCEDDDLYNHDEKA